MSNRNIVKKMNRNLMYDILTLPTVNKAIMNNLNRVDRLNFAIALNDYSEIDNQARSRARTRYHRDADKQYIDPILKYLFDIEECVSQIFEQFREIKNVKIVTTLPYESTASLFGLDDEEIDEEQFSDSDTSDSEDEDASRGNNSNGNYARKSGGALGANPRSTALEERHVKITFTYNEDNHGDLPDRRPNIETLMYSLFAKKLSGGNTSIENETTDLAESIRTSFENSFVSMAPFYTRYAEPNRVIFTKVFVRPETEMYSYSKWSVVITGFLGECKNSRASSTKLLMKLRNDKTIGWTYPRRIPFDMEKVVEYVPPHLKRKSYVEFDQSTIPLQYFDIVQDFVAKTELLYTTKQWWQTLFYEPLLLYRNTISVPNALYYYFTHVRETKMRNFVVSENVSFSNKRTACNRTLLRLDGRRILCNEVTRQIAINEFNKINGQNRISRNYYTSIYHSFSHSPVINPFAPNSSRLSKRSSETVSKYVKRMKEC